MRILHFSWEYPPLMYGGLGAHVLALTQEQARRGHEVTVITQAPIGEPAVPEYLNDVRVIRVANHYPDARLGQENFDYWVHGFALASLSAVEQLDAAPEIVHGHDWLACDQLFASSREFSVPSILTVHATEFGRHNGWLTSKLSRIVYSSEHRSMGLANSVIVCSESMRNEIRTGYGLQPKALNVIPNAISPSDTQQETSAVTRKETDQGTVVGFIGRLEWEKGIHHIIDAIGLIDDLSVKLEIVGTGSQWESLQAKVARKGVSERIQFLGHVADEGKDAILDSWDVAVIPSSYEPFGIVALELGQRAIPIVASKVGGLADIISTEEFGYPLHEITGAAIAQAILSIKSDREQARARADRLRERIATEFTWGHVCNLTDDTYEQAYTDAHEKVRA
ncbi:MAG: glycosyltransferase family 4 protein [Candidatus Nanopelagicales bacterium]